MSEEQIFELVFEGPVDDSPQTLQRIKGVFIADLDFPVSNVQQFLQALPATVKTSSTEEELSQAYKLLKEAGAKVLIVRPAGDEKSDTTVELDLNLEESQKESREPKVYTLDLDEDDGSASILDLVKKCEEKYDDSPSSSGSLSLDDGAEVPIKAPHPAKLPDSNPPASPASNLSTLEFENEPAPPSSQLHRAVKQEEPAIGPPPAQTPPLPPRSAPPSPLPKLDDSLELDLTLGSAEDAQPALAAPAGHEDGNDDLLNLLPLNEPEDQGKKEASDPAPPAESGSSFEGPSEQAGKPTKTELQPAPADLAITLGQESQPDLEAKPAAAEKPGPVADAPRDVIPPVIEDAAEAAPEPEWHPAAEGKGKRRVPVELVLPIIVGSVVLTLANWAYFEGKSPPPVSELTEEERSQLNELDNVSEVDKPSESSLVQLTQANGGFELRASVELVDKKPFRCSVSLTTPPPPELTKQQIVEGESRAPWLRRVEVRDLSLLAADSGYRGEGIFMGYVEHKGAPKRISGRVQVRIGEDLAFSLEGASPGTEFSSEPFSFSMDEQGIYELRFHAEGRLAPAEATVSG